MKPTTRWMVTADVRRARLLSLRELPDGRWRAEEHGALESRWEDFHEHGRPSALGRGPVASASQHFASIGHEPEEQRRRFARDVMAWLVSNSEQLSIDQVNVFAPPGMLGTLREEVVSGPVRIALLEGELTRLSPHELEAHPAVMSAVA